MPDESGAITMALVLTMWCLALLGFLGALVWTRSRAAQRMVPARVVPSRMAHGARTGGPGAARRGEVPRP
jgi:hypothetical protein